eukprot:11269154-Ditylum_brightwellii.AAC.1
MSTNKVGSTPHLPGEKDGVKVDVFDLKEPNYVMLLMSTYDGNIIKDGQKSLRLQDDGTSIEFQYTEVFSNHYDCRDAVDSNNNKHHDGESKHGLSLEETWKTTHWAMHIFCFILAVVEVNAFLAKVYFQGHTGTELDFCKSLAYELVSIKLDREDEVDEKTHRTHQATTHTLCMVPKFCAFVMEKSQNATNPSINSASATTPF